MIAKQELTIQITGWNSAKVLAAGLEALQPAPTDKIQVRYIDNNSQDGSVQLVRDKLPGADIIRLKKNIGFAGAHNIGLAICDTPYVMTHDPDLVINLNALQELLDKLKDEKIGAVQGKLWRQDKANKKTIDSAGIIRTYALNGRERGAGEEDMGQYKEEAPLMAVTGAAGIYRLAALQSIAYGFYDAAGYNALEVFDKHFFAYKEDVDVGWRLTRAGWQVKYYPLRLGEHRRTLGKRGAWPWAIGPRHVWQRLKSERTRYSFRNWSWLIIKNADIFELIMYGPGILSRLFIMASAGLLYWPLGHWVIEAIEGLPAMLRRRRMKRNVHEY